MLELKYNVKLTIAYDGTDYAGLQYQPKERTIQSQLEHAIQKMHNPKLEDEHFLYFAGRTDAGVHANAMTVNFHTWLYVPPDRIIYAINRLLPHDIRVLSAEYADMDFNSRYDAIYREYIYKIKLTKVISPFDARYYAHVYYPIVRDRFRRALDIIREVDDFASLTNHGSNERDTRITLDRLEIIHESDDEIITLIGARSFLYRMVRNIMGAALAMGSGKLGEEKLHEIIAVKDREIFGHHVNSAPAAGLYLNKVVYKG